MISIVEYGYHKKITSDLENRSIEITQSEQNRRYNFHKMNTAAGVKCCTKRMYWNTRTKEERDWDIKNNQ